MLFGLWFIWKLSLRWLSLVTRYDALKQFWVINDVINHFLNECFPSHFLFYNLTIWEYKFCRHSPHVQNIDENFHDTPTSPAASLIRPLSWIVSLTFFHVYSGDWSFGSTNYIIIFNWFLAILNSTPKWLLQHFHCFIALDLIFQAKYNTYLIPHTLQISEYAETQLLQLAVKSKIHMAANCGNHQEQVHQSNKCTS